MTLQEKIDKLPLIIEYEGKLYEIDFLIYRNHSTISMMCHKLNEVIDLPQYRKVKGVYTKLKQHNYVQKSIS